MTGAYYSVNHLLYMIGWEKGGVGMSVNEYVKFITQTVVAHFDQPKQQRRNRRLEKKSQRAPILFRWFGVIPFAVQQMFRKK
ncbi:MAG TPA: YqzE family protein [Chondromyces sp.]|nr:YqzE family protein [Chondromyces sp.]